MYKKTITVKTSSSNLWWGIYGLCGKTGWEDLDLFYENGERIGGVCLNAKSYLRAAIADLREEESEKTFVEAIEQYLADDKCHYWFYYDKKEDSDFYEVPYNAPKNDKGVKPRFADIWHTDEGIGIETIKTGISDFAKRYLDLNDCYVEIEDDETLEDYIKSFNDYEQKYNGSNPVKIAFSEEVVEELSILWGKSKIEVLEKLNKAI